MTRVLWTALLVVALVAALGACGDDDDTVVTSPDGAATTTASEEEVTTPTTAGAGTVVEATYEFAVQPEFEFAPTALGVEEGPVTVYVYPGQVVGLEAIELDPEGPACPTEAEIEVTDATGAVVATGTGGEIQMPLEAEGLLTVTMICERDGEPGVGVLEPVVLAESVEVTVTPTTIVTGESATVELTGGCPDGLDGRAGLTPQDGDGGYFGVFGNTPPLGEDGTAELTVPEGATGTLYATVQCYDEAAMTLAVGWAELEVTEG